MKPILKSNQRKARRVVKIYDTIGDMLAADHLRRKGYYPKWFKGVPMKERQA